MPTKLSINIEVRNTLRRFFVFHEKKEDTGRGGDAARGDRADATALNGRSGVVAVKLFLKNLRE